MSKPVNWLEAAAECMRGIEQNKATATATDIELLLASANAMALLDIAASLRRLADAAEADR